MENNKDISILYFNTRDEMIRVDLRKVLYFKSDKNYTDVYSLCQIRQKFDCEPDVYSANQCA